MPLWIIYHPPGTFTDNATKQALAADITKFYTGIGLPAFYVVVNYMEIASGNMWIGGELKTDKPFIRVVIEHIAVILPDQDAAYLQVTTAIDNILKPHVADKGYDWEFHVDETERRLWKVNGFNPPPWHSDGEKLWVKLNKAVEWESKL